METSTYFLKSPRLQQIFHIFSPNNNRTRPDPVHVQYLRAMDSADPSSSPKVNVHESSDPKEHEDKTAQGGQLPLNHQNMSLSHFQTRVIHQPEKNLMRRNLLPLQNIQLVSACSVTHVILSKVGHVPGGTCPT